MSGGGTTNPMQQGPQSGPGMGAGHGMGVGGSGNPFSPGYQGQTSQSMLGGYGAGAQGQQGMFGNNQMMHAMPPNMLGGQMIGAPMLGAQALSGGQGTPQGMTYQLPVSPLMTQFFADHPPPGQGTPQGLFGGPALPSPQMLGNMRPPTYAPGMTYQPPVSPLMTQFFADHPPPGQGGLGSLASSPAVSPPAPPGI